MKITFLRQAPLLLLPALFPLPLLAADNASQTMVVSAAPAASGLSELDTPAAVSVVSGDEMRHAAPRVNLSKPLAATFALIAPTLSGRCCHRHDRGLSGAPSGT